MSIDILAVKARATDAVSPLAPARPEELNQQHDLIRLDPSNLSDSLPAHYLVYLLLVDLLEYSDRGRRDKTLWSIPVRLDDRLFLLEYGKFGYRLFVNSLSVDSKSMNQIVESIKSGIEQCDDYFCSRADRMVETSNLTVDNWAIQLFDRYLYFRDLSKDSLHRTARSTENSPTSLAEKAIAELNLESDRERVAWMSQAAIDAFFCWSEHIFVLLSIIGSTSMTGVKIASLAKSNWHNKYSNVLGLNDPIVSEHYSNLNEIRQSIRNHMAHGAIGKPQAGSYCSPLVGIYFPSSVGGVPLRYPLDGLKTSWRFEATVGVSESEAISRIDNFVDFLWSGSRELAKIYIQDRGLPLRLQFTCDGTYSRALESEDAMNDLVDDLSNELDRVENMEF